MDPARLHRRRTWQGRRRLHAERPAQLGPLGRGRRARHGEPHQGVEVGEGDIVLFRTGYGARWNELGTDAERRQYFTDGEPGLSHHAVPWLADRDVAAVACDTVGFEVLPNEPDAPRVQPVHQALLVDLGLTIGELWDLEAIAEDCATDGVYEFLLVAPPLHIPAAVGSPLNPVAIK